tara:strand:- start:5616 stop:6179 length:564 start_codon:yes stop_codon:yes gene_type:complete
MKSSDTNKISFTEIHQALPQIQCGRCDTPGCKEYAESIVEGAPINRCIPGGNETLKKLQKITGNIDQTLDHSYGPSIEPQVALIVEDSCIGCAKCIPKCPVDAIIGAPGKLHQIDPDLCTGCELCIEPCPVDCIIVEKIKSNDAITLRAQSQERYDRKRLRVTSKKKKISLNSSSNQSVANLYKKLL